MSTDFFNGKRRFVVALLLIVFFALLLAVALRVFSRKHVNLGHRFHYLVVGTENVEVGVFNAQLDGGAGYLLCVDDRQYVALTVYLNEEECMSICEEMRKSGENCAMVSIETATISIKNNEEDITGAFRTFYDYLSLLEQEIFRLDKGATQQSSKRILSILKAQFVFLGERYQDSLSGLSRLCSKTAESLTGCLMGEVYVKDLREILCEASREYVLLTEEFKL